MAGGPVSWSSKRQATVALSTVEAEYVAMSQCAQQMVWMHSWLDEIEVEHTTPGVICGDNHGERSTLVIMERSNISIFDTTTYAT